MGLARGKDIVPSAPFNYAPVVGWRGLKEGSLTVDSWAFRGPDASCTLILCYLNTLLPQSAPEAINSYLAEEHAARF